MRHSKLKRTAEETSEFGLKEVAYHFLSNRSTNYAKYNCLLLIEKDKAYKNLNSEQLYEKIVRFYEEFMDRKMNSDSPELFTEKIQWLKIYNNSELRTQLSDKYAVRKYIADKIGKKYLIPLIAVWNNEKEIKYDDLPENYVLKANHGCAMNVTVKNRNVNIEAVNEKLHWWIRTPYWAESLECQYRDIEKKIIAEKYIEEIAGGLFDYKIHCFNGEPLFIQCIGDRNEVTHSGFQMNYDLNWKKMSWTFSDYPDFPYEVQRPKAMEEMTEIARELSKGFPYVRIDLYDVDGGCCSEK